MKFLISNSGYYKKVGAWAKEIRVEASKKGFDLQAYLEGYEYEAYLGKVPEKEKREPGLFD